MKNPHRASEGAGTQRAAVEDSVPDWSPCQTAAECVTHRCHILYNGEGQMKSFLCRAHALLILFDDPVQA